MGLGTNSGFNRSAADRWAGSRGIRSTHYDVIVVGATEAGCMAAPPLPCWQGQPEIRDSFRRPFLRPNP